MNVKNIAQEVFEIEAKEIAKKGVIAAVGVKPEYQAKNLGYIKRDGNDVIKILSNVDFDDASKRKEQFDFIISRLLTMRRVFAKYLNL